MRADPRIFRDRNEGGRLLAEKLLKDANRPDVMVLALLRGSVPIGVEVSKKLKAPLDVLIVRKLGVPGQPELAMGTLASGGIRVLNRDLLAYLPISPGEIEAITKREQKELERRERLYRGDRPHLDVRGRTVILVDDGIATGMTMQSGTGIKIFRNSPMKRSENSSIGRMNSAYNETPLLAACLVDPTGALGANREVT